MTHSELLKTVVGKKINEVNVDFGTCYPIVKNPKLKNPVILDVVCAEFGSTQDGKKWENNGNVAWFI